MRASSGACGGRKNDTKWGRRYEGEVVSLLRYLHRGPELSEKEHASLEKRGIEKDLCYAVVPWAVSSTSMSTTSSSRPAFWYVLR